MRLRTAALAAASIVLALTPAAATAKKPHKQRGGGHGHTYKRTVDVQLLALNDFHGNLEPPAGSGGRITQPDGTNVDAGGVEYLATHVKQLRQANPKNTVTVSAGDLIGASPLLSALFHDEPTVEAMNSLGLDLNAVGNHEFDEGTLELLRMQHGGCHPVDGCVDGDGFEGANFDFLGANVQRASGRTIFPPYKIKKFDGVKVAFIGMTLEGTPSIVSPSGIQGYQFKDEADTVNALVPKLREKGVRTIVVLLHEGGVQTGTYNGCTGISGPIVDIVKRTNPEVDLFVTGHTHQAYNCKINGKPVTSAASFGRLVTDIDLKVDRRTGQPTQIAANNKIVTRTVPKDAAQTALVQRYAQIAGPIAARVIGQASAALDRVATPAGETSLGDVIADAQLEATQPSELGGAQIAFMNPGGIRADIDAGDVTYGEAFTVQPFGNNLVTITLTGAQIDTLLEQQWQGQASPKILQVSRGFSYTWTESAAAGSKVDPATIKLNGVTVDPAGTYRVTVNSFLADGGDGFVVLRDGTNRLGGVVDTDALEAYFKANSPVAPGPKDRIAKN